MMQDEMYMLLENLLAGTIKRCTSLCYKWNKIVQIFGNTPWNQKKLIEFCTTGKLFEYVRGGTTLILARL